MQQAAGGSGLETLRDHLGVYLKILRSAMIELINRDYADFVNLSTNLTGLDRLIEALKTPLGQLREEVLVCMGDACVCVCVCLSLQDWVVVVICI